MKLPGNTALVAIRSELEKPQPDVERIKRLVPQVKKGTMPGKIFDQISALYDADIADNPAPEPIECDKCKGTGRGNPNGICGDCGGAGYNDAPTPSGTQVVAAVAAASMVLSPGCSNDPKLLKNIPNRCY